MTYLCCAESYWTIDGKRIFLIINSSFMKKTTLKAYEERRILEEAEMEDSGLLPDQEPALPVHLHSAIKEIVAPFPAEKKAAMAIISLAYLGTMAGNARFLYRNSEEHYLGFECCLIGEQGIGKSAMTRLHKDLMSVLISEDEKTRMKVDEYDDACNACGENGAKPRDPHYGIRIMSPDTTKSAFFLNLKNLKGKRAIIVAPEIDSLLKSGNWCCDRGANERLMFDTEIGGQDTKCHNSTKARVRIAVNLAVSGTPVAVMRHYKNAEDGLVTRVAFCSFPETMNDDDEEKPRSEANRRKLLEIQKRLLDEPVGDVIKVPALLRQQKEWYTEMKRLSDVSGNHSIETFRKRAAVIGFRAGCVLYLLDGHKITRNALRFARWVSEYVLYYQMKYFGEKMNESIEANAEIMRAPVYLNNKNAWVFTSLPTVFTPLDVFQKYEELGMKASGYRSTIKRWKEAPNGWIFSLGDGRYGKTERGLAIQYKDAK